jgi:retron-type reverse transcriptase
MLLPFFCDLRKPFDTVNHDLLPKKLNKLALQSNNSKMVSKIAGRKQFVTIDGRYSNLIDIILGVPQGSVLGPLHCSF